MKDDEEAVRKHPRHPRQQGTGGGAAAAAAAAATNHFLCRMGKFRDGKVCFVAPLSECLSKERRLQSLGRPGEQLSAAFGSKRATSVKIHLL